MLTNRLIILITTSFSLFGIFPSLIYCWKKNQLDAKKHTLSDCGSRDSKIMFNLSLALFALLQTGLSTALTKELAHTKPNLIIAPISAGLLLFLAAIINNQRKFIHRFFASLAVLTSFFWILALQMIIFYDLPRFTLISFTLLISLAISTIFTTKKYGVCLIPELVILGGIFTLDVLFSATTLFYLS